MLKCARNLNILPLTVLRSMLTCHADLISWLGVSQEVRADALFLGVFCVLFRVPESCSSHAKRSCLSVVLVAVSRGSNGIQSGTVGHLLSSGVCLLTLRENSMRLIRVNLRPRPDGSHANGYKRSLTGGMTPYDWPSQKGMSPFVSMIM